MSGQTSQHRDVRSNAGLRSLESMREPHSSDHYVSLGAPLATVIAAFERRPDLRLVPVADEDLRPVGAIFEKDMRRLLFNPYGHALLKNPGFGRTLDAYRKDCPFAEVETPLAQLLEIYASAGGTEGMILTDRGRVCGILSARTLIRLAASRESEILQERSRRIEGIEREGGKFRADASMLADTLMQVAFQIEETASDMADRATENGARASSVASASAQTGMAMRALADRGNGLAEAIDRIGGDTVAARKAAAEAVKLVRVGAQRTDQLAVAAQEIESMLAVIDTLARRANMLAMNAAIEAARVGEAGAGFAVVAREFRQYSVETRGAAAEITTRVDQIRAAADAVAEGHTGFERVIGTIDILSQSVDTALGAQLATMRLLTESATQVALAETETREILRRISGVSDAAATGSTEMRTMAARLATDAARLNEQVSGFLDKMQES